MSYTTDFDALLKRLSAKEINPDRLVTDNPTPNTVRLFDFLKQCYGKKHISGQQYLFESELEDLVYYKYTGKLPAIRGYDFMGMGGLARGYDQFERALDWARNTGGILTLCWHWYAPDDMNDFGKGCGFYYKTTDYDTKTGFDIVKAVSEGTAEYDFVTAQIDLAAQQLKRFEAEDIPVLWRPLHEANGGWFWWGNHGEESVQAYKKLWYMMFDRLMNYHGLKNLIWVWNGQSRELAVSPNTFDIVGEDIYDEVPNHSSQVQRFRDVGSYTHGKMITLSECGAIPDPDEMQRDGAMWLWWLPWWGQFVHENGDNHKPIIDADGFPRPNPKYMDERFLKRLFNDKRVITLADLPWHDENKHRLPTALLKNLEEINKRER